MIEPIVLLGDSNTYGDIGVQTECTTEQQSGLTPVIIYIFIFITK